MIENHSLCLNEIRKNLAANLDRSPLIHSYCYASAGDRSTFADRDVGARAMQEQLAAFAIFPLNFVPFMQHTG
jgi:hypothetical protein